MKKLKTILVFVLVFASTFGFSQTVKTEAELSSYINDSLTVGGVIQSSKFLQLMKDFNASKEDSTWIDSFINDLLTPYITDYTVTEGDVTTHEGALSITANQVSDFDTEVSNNSSVVANTAKVSYPGSANTTELNILDGALVSTAELNYSVGVTSSIQTQLNSKLPKSEFGDSLNNYLASDAYYTASEVQAKIDSVAALGGSGTADSIRVLSSAPESGNAYIDSASGVFWWKGNVQNYWYAAAKADSISTVPEAVVILEDDFETGSADAGWVVQEGTVNTYANFGISAPTGGGTYGMEIESLDRIQHNPSSPPTEVWMKLDFRTGSTATTRTYFGRIGNVAATADSYPRFSSDASPKVEVYNSIAAETYTGTSSLAASTWYTVKIRFVVSATVGVVQVWVDSGSGYVLEIDESGLNTGTGVLDRLYIGNNVLGGQTGYADNVGFYESNPD